MRRSITLVVAGLLASQPACSRPPKSIAPTPVNVITREDIERIHAATALDAVSRYRNDVLVARPPSSIYLNQQRHPAVFQDAQFFGQVDELRNISADGIGEIRFYNGPDAVRLFGAQYSGGVIQIVSRTGD